MANFPKDQFDEIPTDLSRVGAHRGPRAKGRAGVRFAWAALATGVLVVGGLYGLSRINPDINFTLPNFGGDPSPEASSSASAAPEVLPAPATTADPITPTAVLNLSVFNGSSTDGVQDKAGDALVAAGWSNPARANATARDETETTIYYRSTEYEAIARGIAATLGVGTVQLSDAFLGAPVTIVVGADYAATVAP